MLEAEDVGTAIGRLRGDRTQLEVAKRAGINRSSWSSYESGRRMPKPETYGRIVHGLECTEGELDRAVLRAWRERLDRERETEPADSATAPAAAATQAGVTVTLEEIIDLAAHSEHLQELARRVLRRHGVPPQR